MNPHQAHALAFKLMVDHGLQEKGWSFEFDQATRRFGRCYYRRKLITLSEPLVSLNDESRVRNTILHEIAHALTEGHHHDEVWRAKAIEIGCDGKRCYDSEEVAAPQQKYLVSCPNGHVYQRSRKPMDGRSYSCGKCSNKFNRDHLLVFSLNPNYIR